MFMNENDKYLLVFQCAIARERATRIFFIGIFRHYRIKLLRFESLFGCKQLTILNCILFAYNLK